MSHDIEAAYASSEVADLIMRNQDKFFGNLGTKGAWSVFAGREGGHKWPLADGVICAQNTNHKEINIAFEYKRPNEGVHGILTALGQSFAYLEKGYDASVMVIPDRYSAHTTPGDHVKRVLDATSPDIPISIFTYSAPNLSAPRPFLNRLTCVRDISLPYCREIKRTVDKHSTPERVSTLWAHVREGMSHPDAFFRYCQSVKIVCTKQENYDYIKIPKALENAVSQIDKNADVLKYLSCTSGDSISDRAWRYVWFNFYFWNDMIPLYKAESPFVANDIPTKIQISPERMQKIFSGRIDSLKNVLVDQLNSHKKTIEDVWKEYAKEIHNEAHSYREVIDSGLYHIGFLAGDGSLTELGYKYVDACERIGHSHEGVPFEILRASFLQNGQYGALLHYFYKFSEERFSDDLFAFTEKKDDKYKFLSDEYLAWLDNIFTEKLHIIQKSSERSGGTRRKFQAELWILKKLGFVKKKGQHTAYRIGVGLEIDWPQVESSMLYFQGL